MTLLYNGSGISFPDDVWEASSLGFQSSFTNTWYLVEVLVIFHDWLVLGRCFRGFVLPVFEYCSAVYGARLPIHTCNYKTVHVQSVVLAFKLWVCLSETLNIVDLWQYYVWRVSRTGPMPFYWPSCSLYFCLLYCFPIPFF